MDYNIIGIVMILVWLFSICYPWHLRWPAAKWALHLPILLLALYWGYETAMPSHMNIRLDLPLIWGCMIISAILYVTRIILFVSMAKRSRSSGPRE